MNELVLVLLLILFAGVLVAKELLNLASQDSLQTKTVSIKDGRSPLPPWYLPR